MHDNMIDTIVMDVTEKQSIKQPNTTEPYSAILEQYGVDYQKADFYWQFGKPRKIQGWILHISVIAPQLSELLTEILPILLSAGVPFKIPKDRTTARTILDGNLGPEQIGKVITIYPDSDQDAIALTRQLLEKTKTYRGPIVPTDIHLGYNIYTRYGGFNPITKLSESGIKKKYIYNSNGQLIEDQYMIPFEFPVGINWPFQEFTSYLIIPPKRNLKNIYRPLQILKPDARGNVVKGIYLKGLLNIGHCVIKQGKKNMLADDLGRDIRDRLKWQYELHQQLTGLVPLPFIIDLFEENDDTYLVMELIKGQSLHERIIAINGGHRSWFQLSPKEQLLITEWLIKIVSTIDVLHKKGFVHRDLAPGNFIIDKNGNIILIDVELAYHIGNQKQESPFELGTPGFMSPEQEAISIPSFQEDVYGIGALIANCLTGISPLKFNTKNNDTLKENLNFFLRDEELASLISGCLRHHPEERPSIIHIKNCLQGYRKRLETQDSRTLSFLGSSSFSSGEVRQVIQDCLKGFSERPMPVSEGLWMSKTLKKNYEIITGQKDYTAYPGLHTGMGGVLYLLARAHRVGFPLDPNRETFETSWNYVINKYLTNPASITPGLYSGAAGLALALKEGIGSLLLEDNSTVRGHLLANLIKPNEKLSLIEGVAGQGITILQNIPYLEVSKTKELLDKCINQILTAQLKDGSWKIRTEDSTKEHVMPVGLAHGVSGVLWFLLDYIGIYSNSQVEMAVNKGLHYLLKRTDNLEGLFDQIKYKKILGPFIENGDERTGVILCVLKAYEVLGEKFYRDATEKALYQYPNFVTSTNLSQDGGIASLGELYLDAARVFREEEWQTRAKQIASVYLHLAYRTDTGSYYWLMDETNKPSSDLLTGNAGILHFLMRCIQPDQLGHILLK
jgi:tRNA A-37 threonylcarbamoyl transferase component Bud32